MLIGIRPRHAFNSNAYARAPTNTHCSMVCVCVAIAAHTHAPNLFIKAHNNKLFRCCGRRRSQRWEGGDGGGCMSKHISPIECYDDFRIPHLRFACSCVLANLSITCVRDAARRAAQICLGTSLLSERERVRIDRRSIRTNLLDDHTHARHTRTRVWGVCVLVRTHEHARGSCDNRAHIYISPFAYCSRDGRTRACDSQRERACLKLSMPREFYLSRAGKEQYI